MENESKQRWRRDMPQSPRWAAGGHVGRAVWLGMLLTGLFAWPGFLQGESRGSAASVERRALSGVADGNDGSDADGLLLVMVSLGEGWAPPNPSRFTDSFEAYGDGNSMTGSNGWSGAEGALVVVVTNQPYDGQVPLPGASHGRVARIQGAATNRVVMSHMASNLWVDMLIRPGHRSPDTLPARLPDDTQAAFYVDTNGQLNAYCGFYASGGVPSNTWVSFPQTKLRADEWGRLSVAFWYNATFFGETFFQIHVSGSPALTNQLGQTGPGTGDTGGSCFLAPDRLATRFCGLTFRGSGEIDDLVVSIPFFERFILGIAGPGTSIDPPSCSVTVGDDQRFRITADTLAGWALTKLWWGPQWDYAGSHATNAIPITNTASMSYTFTNVWRDYCIKAEACRPGWLGTHTAMGTTIEWLEACGLTNYPTAHDAELGDDDGDGDPNWKEYVADTGPKDRDSRFAPRCEFEALDSWCMVIDPSSTARLYVGLCSTNLPQGWAPAGAARCGNGGELNVTYTNPAGSMVFWGPASVSVPD